MSELHDLVAELTGEEPPAASPQAGRKNRRKRKNADFSAAPTTKRSQPDAVGQQRPSNTSSCSGVAGVQPSLTSPIETIVSNVPAQSSGGNLNGDGHIAPLQQPYWVNSMAGRYQHPDTPRSIEPAPYGMQSRDAGRSTQEVRLPLGDDVFLTIGLFRGKPLISVRLFYRPDPADVNKMRPGKVGLSMSPAHWEALKAQPLLGAILDCTYATMPIDNTTFSPKSFELGGRRFVTIQVMRGQPVVSLTQLYKPYGEPDTAPLQRKGINLTMEQWNDLETKMETVDKLLAGMQAGKDPVDKDLIQTAVAY
ncbi:uncharacterized protein LOC144919215 [Branchiostoma floridae x Branchiostoma belcheri]